jgi:UDP-glucose 4-epimerase
MNILIFGSEGNIGSALTREFIKNNAIKKILLIDIVKNSTHKSRKIEYFNFSNINDKNFKIRENFEIIIFTSFITDFRNERIKKNYLRNNINIIQTGINLLKKDNSKRLIYLSSVAVYGKKNVICDEKTKTTPYNIYSYTKLKIENFIKNQSKKYKFKYLILRLPHVYGPNITNNFISSFIKKKIISIDGDGTQIRNLLHIHDLYNFIVKSMNFKKNYTLNIGHEQFSLNEIVKILGKNYKYRNQSTGPKNQIINFSKAKKLFKWRPIFYFKNTYK